MTNVKFPTPEEIESRAYALYLVRGSEDGNALADWLAAEREVTEQAQRELAGPSHPDAPHTLAASANQQSSSSETVRQASAK